MPSTLHEDIKDQYNREFDIKSTLETKANNITSISGTLAGLVFGLGQFLIAELIDIKYPQLQWVIGFFIVSIAASTFSLWFSIRAWKEKGYYYVVWNKVMKRSGGVHGGWALETRPDNRESELERLFREDKLPERHFPEDKLPPQECKYLYCLAENSKINAKKAFRVTWSQHIFIISMLTLPLPLLVLLFFP